jgi:hypothetical protein
MSRSIWFILVRSGPLAAVLVGPVRSASLRSGPTDLDRLPDHIPSGCISDRRRCDLQCRKGKTAHG